MLFWFRGIRGLSVLAPSGMLWILRVARQTRVGHHGGVSYQENSPTPYEASSRPICTTRGTLEGS